MKQLSIYFSVGTLQLFLLSCGPGIHLSTVHPDSDKTITFTTSRGAVKGTITEMRLNIEGSNVATGTGENLTYTGGPYPAYSNLQLHYGAVAKTSTGSSKSTSGWVYVANPKGVFTFAAPNGSNNNYPNSTSEQTGANLYRLDRRIVRLTAQDALLEYANENNTSVAAISNIADELVGAVAYYVDKHMSWRSDSLNRIVFANNGFGDYSPGWDFPQPADLTLTISGNLTNAAPNDDYQGDCEDHAILRAALLRALGFAPWAIWDAIDRQKREDGTYFLTHEYNIVLYEGAFRIMDYGLIDRWLDSHTWNSHSSYYGWNENNGPRGANATTHNFLKNNTDNFPGGKACPGEWNYEKYYRSHCN
ncbi:MAG: hypothetical protein H3C64_06425 [Candidatus Kuenenia stuttgartiensis]|nr:hypothetical protein [Candidatus Kuenenia stuttgartiensis]